MMDTYQVAKTSDLEYITVYPSRPRLHNPRYEHHGTARPYNNLQRSIGYRMRIERILHVASSYSEHKDANYEECHVVSPEPHRSNLDSQCHIEGRSEPILNAKHFEDVLSRASQMNESRRSRVQRRGHGSIVGTAHHLAFSTEECDFIRYLVNDLQLVSTKHISNDALCWVKIHSTRKFCNKTDKGWPFVLRLYNQLFPLRTRRHAALSARYYRDNYVPVVDPVTEEVVFDSNLRIMIQQCKVRSRRIHAGGRDESLPFTLVERKPLAASRYPWVLEQHKTNACSHIAKGTII